MCVDTTRRSRVMEMVTHLRKWSIRRTQRNGTQTKNADFLRQIDRFHAIPIIPVQQFTGCRLNNFPPYYTAHAFMKNRAEIFGFCVLATINAIDGVRASPASKSHRHTSGKGCHAAAANLFGSCSGFWHIYPRLRRSPLSQSCSKRRISTVMCCACASVSIYVICVHGVRIIAHNGTFHDFMASWFYIDD